MFRRITQLVTPPVRKATHSDPAPLPEREPDLGTVLRPLLKRLAVAPSLETPGIQECLAEIKQIATNRGLYQVAFEIRTQLDTLPKADEHGNPFVKQRGYILAGDFFLAHIRRELEVLRSDARLVGPNVFRGYCDEMVECLLRSANVRRAIEIPALITDELLAAVLSYPRRGEAALDLAVQAATGSRALVVHRYDRQPDPASRSSVSSDSAKSPFVSLDEGCVEYAENLLAKVRDLRTRVVQHLSEFAAQQASSGAETLFPSPVQLTQACLGIAKTVRHHPFSALVMERAGSLVSPGDAGKIAMFLGSAGAFYEEQGDLELDLFFTKLSGIRYRRAEDLYTRVGDADGVARAHQKTADAALRGKH